MSHAKLSRTAIDDLIASAEALLAACSELNLRCRDSPVVTTRLMQHIGLSQYRQRSLWDLLGSLSREKYEIYKHVRTSFTISFSVKRGKLMHVDGWVPVDILECKANENSCSVSPRGSAGYVYVEGSVEDSQIRINAVNLLRILDMTTPFASRAFLHAIRDLLWGRDVDSALEHVARVASIDVMRIVLPKVPLTPRDLLRLSPALRLSLRGIGHR
ncbi:MAG: hypothetical protein ACP5HK_00680 [Acidilobus sp.]